MLKQRTNGPVNAHLISGPSISTKHTNLDKIAEQTLTLILITQNPSLTHSRLFHYILLPNNEPLLYFSVQVFHEYFCKKIEFFMDLTGRSRKPTVYNMPMCVHFLDGAK